MKRLFAVLCLVSAALFSLPAQAQTPRQITWDDLMPPGKEIEDPFSNLSFELAFQLDEILAVRALKSTGQISEVSPEYERAVELEHELRNKGVEVDTLLHNYEVARAEIEKQNSTVVDALDGQFIKLPGYALPLEFTGTAVREFLLVPYVGACIHVPPPPLNQMVLVQLAEPFEAKGLFEPVWIKGRVTVETSETILHLTDGKAPVTSGYRVSRATVEPYRD